MVNQTTPPVTVDFLQRLPIFSNLPQLALEALLCHSRIHHLPHQERLSSRHRDQEENYCFVLEGCMAIVQGSQGAASSPRIHPDLPYKYIGLFSCGDFFSDGFLTITPKIGKPSLDCVASTPTTLLTTLRPTLVELAGHFPAWFKTLTRRMEEARRHFQLQQDPTRHHVQDFFLRHGFTASSKVRVRQLEQCLDCNKCEEACAERHGFSRGFRTNLRLGTLAFQHVCRQCIDHPCLEACSFGALTQNDQGDMGINQTCKGCGACARACPNNAIFIVQAPYTLADFPESIPVHDSTGKTNIPGLFVAGDVSGAALIKPSMNEAVAVVHHLPPRRMPPTHSKVLDLIIIGAGPAGLAAAMRCHERNLRYIVLEKDRTLSTLRHYPKNKFIMAEPCSIPLTSSLWFSDCHKEELLSRWQAAVTQNHLSIREQAEVRQITRLSDGTFQVLLEDAILCSENVLVCVGKRGSPRTLAIPGDDPLRVHYSLSDPDTFRGQPILVVGGGDSAVEAALSLADVPGTQVTISYRQSVFSRVKTKNRERLSQYQCQGRIQVFLNSKVRVILPSQVRLSTAAGEVTLHNHHIFALLGADPPTAFLQQAGIQILIPGSSEMATHAAHLGTHQRAVKCDHCAGYSDRACFHACPTGALLELSPQDLFMETSAALNTHSHSFSGVAFLEGIAEHRSRPSHHPMTTVVTVFLFILLAAVGLECFLRRTLPEHSLTAHVFQSLGTAGPIAFTSGRGFGHVLGYVGTSFMLLTLLYPMHTRLGFLKTLGAQSTWLKVHLWVGFIGATLVTYHAAFKLDRWVGLACMAMWMVVLSGVMGRFLYAKVHSGMGLVEFKRLSKQTARQRTLHYLKSAEKVLRHWNYVHIALTILMFTLAAIHITYGFMYKAT